MIGSYSRLGIPCSYIVPQVLVSNCELIRPPLWLGIQGLELNPEARDPEKMRWLRSFKRLQTNPVPLNAIACHCVHSQYLLIR